MFVFITPRAHDGQAYVVRAGRFWPSGQKQKVEVVDLEKGVDVDPVEVATGDGKKVSSLPLDRIGLLAFEAIKKDPRFNVLSDLESQGAINEEIVHAARRAAEDAAGRAVDLETENAALKRKLNDARESLEHLEHQNDGLRKDRDALQVRVAGLEAELAAAKAASGVAAATGAPEPPKAEGKKAK